MREDWIECTVGDLLKLKNGFAFKSSNYKSEGIPVLRIGDIQDWSVDIENAKRIEENEEYDSHIVNKGDILIAMSGATTGKFGIYNSDKKAYQNQRVGNLIPHSESLTIKNYIYFLLYSLKRDIEIGAYGGAQPNISATKIEALKTKLFPLPTQKAIVKKIEELFSSLDSGIADLKKAQDQLTIYRQAVLKEAFDTQKYSVKLIKDVVEKVQIGPFGSQLHKADYIFEGIPLINPMHIQDGKLKPNPNYTISKIKRDSLTNYILQDGDVIMGRRGEMGRSALITKKEIGWFCGTGSLYLRPNLSLLSPNYLNKYIQSSTVKALLTGSAAGTTMMNLNKKIISTLPIPIPTLKQQHQIVQEIESRLSVCDKVEKDIADSLEKAQALRQSILKKAFDGKLLNEEEIAKCKADKDYEPASVLLEKIKAEKKQKIK